MCQEPGGESGPRSRGGQLHAGCYLVDVDVASGLRRLVASKATSTGRAAAALTDLDALPLERYPHVLLLPRVWQLRANLSAYDASYAALAETLSAPC